jgi:Skp family chaperone for outer membrane proteins
MVLSTRGILAIGLGIVGLSLLVGPILAQQDGTVRKTAGPGGGSGGAAPAAPIPPIIGTVDMDAVFKGYEKFKSINKDFQAAVFARQNELMKLESEAKEETQMLSKLTPGTADFKKHEDRVTELKARFAAGREQAQREFQARESENVATIYKEVQLMVTAWAQYRKMNYVFRVTNLQPNGADPSSVMAALQNNVVYFDPRNDITNDVIYNLNRRYKAISANAAAGGSNASSPAATAQPAADSGARTDQK